MPEMSSLTAVWANENVVESDEESPVASDFDVSSVTSKDSIPEGQKGVASETVPPSSTPPITPKTAASSSTEKSFFSDIFLAWGDEDEDEMEMEMDEVDGATPPRPPFLVSPC